MRHVGTLVVVWLVCASCGSKREAAPGSAASPSPPLASDAAVAPPGAGSAVVDGPVAVDAPIAVDASPPDAPAAAALAPFTTVPALGCLGWSADRQQVACVVGQRGVNLDTPSHVALMLIGTGAKAAEPDLVPLIAATSPTDPGDDALSAEATAAVADALRGFVALDRSQGRISSKEENYQLVMSPAITVGGMEVAVKTRRNPATGGAPSYRTTLTVQRPGRPVETLESGDKLTSALEVHAYALGEVVIVEQRHREYDEGLEGEFGSVWRCTATRCAPPVE